jgi:uncharacterized protein (DUF1810 family)
LGKREENDFSKFIEKNKEDYPKALNEIANGLKISHWMWYIFPQLKGLGYSENSNHFGLKSFAEAKEYAKNCVLLDYLVRITKIVETHLEKKTIKDIFGVIDNEKFLSCMTLFHYVVKELNPEEFQPYAVTISNALSQEEIIDLFATCQEIAEKELKKQDAITRKACGVEVSMVPQTQSYSFPPYASSNSSNYALLPLPPPPVKQPAPTPLPHEFDELSNNSLSSRETTPVRTNEQKQIVIEVVIEKNYPAPVSHVYTQYNDDSIDYLQERRKQPYDDFYL